MASNANLVISINARDNASGTFRKIRVDLGELERSTGGLEDATGGLGDIFDMLPGKLGPAAAVLSSTINKFAQQALELGKLGAAAQRTQASFEQLAQSVGQSSDRMLSAMREATNGTVTNSELMLAANRAIMLGVADDADEMARLMAVAIERGRALGVSAQQAVSDLITGIGRMSPEILDNLGIIGATAAIEEYAASVGKTADQLTDLERKQALVNVVLSQSSSGGQVVDDAAAAFERMDAALQNSREALGELFAPAVAAIANQIAAAVEATADAAQRASAEWPEDLRGTSNAGALGGNRAQMFGPVANQPIADPIIDAQEELQRLERLAADAQSAIRELNAQNAPLADSGDVIARSMNSLTIEQNNQQIRSLTQVLTDATARMQDLGVATTRTQAETSRLGESAWDAISSWQTFGETASASLQTFGESASAVLDQLRQSAQATTQELTQAIQQSAQSSLLSIAQDIALEQGPNAAIAWYRNANAEIARQIELWQELGYEQQDILNIALPAYLESLRQVSDASSDAAAATAAIGQGALEADLTAAGALRRLATRVGAITQSATLARNALTRMGSALGSAGVSDGLQGIRSMFTQRDAGVLGSTADASERLARGLDSVINAANGGGGGGLSGVADQFEDIRSAVQSVIDQSTTLDVGLNPADFLPREDAINENARRLAAIMRDGLGNQEWMDEFKREVPGIFDELAASDDPRAAAARILQQFQAGMRPELLDREQIKNRVRQMILGDQSSAQLAQEIAQELSGELNVSLAQAQQAANSVLGGGALLPTAVDQTAPDAAEPAQAFVSQWSATVGTLLGTFDASGRQAGNAFGLGFVAVQSTYIEQWAQALVALVTAGVVANMAAQQSRTGAR